MTAALPHNGQALAIDLADANNPGDIHPKDKQSVGLRLALVALAKTYAKQSTIPAPNTKMPNLKAEGRPAFQIRRWHDRQRRRALKGFQIAGEDKKWRWADAKIDGDSVIVSSTDVANGSPFGTTGRIIPKAIYTTRRVCRRCRFGRMIGLA